MKNNTITILAFDPGLSFLGWSILEYHVKTGKIFVPKFGSIIGSVSLKNNKDLKGEFQKRFIILNEAEKEVEALITSVQPDFVVSEAAFQGKFADAYAALVLVIHMIRRSSFVTRRKDIFTIPPREVKFHVAGHGGASKQEIYQAIMKNENVEIKNRKDKPVENMLDHESDSIGVGLTFIILQLKTILASLNLDHAA